MRFEEYIKALRDIYEVEETSPNVFRITKKDNSNDKELIITPARMFDEEYLTSFFEDNKKGFKIGEDDLLPKIDQDSLLTGRSRKVKGSVPSPDDILQSSYKENSEDENPFIKKDGISPLKGKKGPDPDHFKKPGDDDDPNKFMY